jgi:hypothetical protein
MKRMREVALLLQDMVSAGAINSYAVFAAVAQMRYTEAVLTEDANVLDELLGEHSLDALAPIYAYCRSRGLPAQGQRIRGSALAGCPGGLSGNDRAGRWINKL